MKESLRKLAHEARAGTPGEFAAFIRAEMEQRARLVEFAGSKRN